MVLILLAQKVTNKCGKKTFEQKKTTWLKSGLKPLLVNRKHGKGAGGIGRVGSSRRAFGWAKMLINFSILK